jgi:putative aldouronate transport system substrate-binding protein
LIRSSLTKIIKGVHEFMKEIKRQKTQFKRMIALSATVCAMGIVAASCSKAAEPSAGTKSNNAAGEKRGSISATIYDRGKVPSDEGTIEKNRWTEWINKTSPVDVKFIPVPRAEAVQKLNVMFASGDVPDVILEFDKNFRDQLYNQKQLLPIDDLIEKHSTEYKKLLAQYPQLKKVGTQTDGKMYEFGRVSGSRPQDIMIIREDWLKKLNLPVPQTTEELFKVAKAFTEQDPDGNGKNDTYGLSLAAASGNILSIMFGDAGWMIDNNNMIKPWDRMQAALDFKKRLFDANIVDKDYFTDKNVREARHLRFLQWHS